VLGDDAAAPRFIETVVGKGYRFIADVESVAAADERVAGRGEDHAGGPRYTVRAGGQEFVLRLGETVLGRDPAAGVCVDHPSVSRRHARISIEAGRAWLQDLGSRNGTFLNGQRLDEATTEMQEEGIIGLGPVTLEFRMVRAPASTRSMSGQ
jgi:hypothetical protein